ncbi:PAS domain S-box-containing protein [Mucilaginibacter sp. UYNi724]
MNNFNILFYSAPNPMWVFDIITLQILEVNNAAVTAYGYSKQQFLSKTIKDLRPPEDMQLVERIISEIKTDQTYFREFRHQDSCGRTFDVEIMSYAMIFDERQVRLVVTQNIEEKKAIAGQLKFTQHKLSRMLETTSIGFFQVDHNSIVTYWNRAAEGLIGYNRKYVLGKNLWDVFPEVVDTDFYSRYQQAIKERRNEEFISYFWPIQKWFTVIIYYVEEGVIIHFRDITESKIYEEQLLDKIVRLKEVSHLNSHYLRKPVASLLGLADLITNALISNDEFKMAAGYIKECSLELDAVLRKVNNKVNNELEPVAYEEIRNFSLNKALGQVIAEVQKQFTVHTIVLNSKENVTCYGNEHSIAVAVKQLLYNAINFSPSANRVEVCLEVVSKNAIVSVRDFGIGIDSQTLNRIFMSFINKSVAEELGTGLSKVSDVALRHNGNVWVESKPGKGATFSMRLPMSNIGVYKQIGNTNFSDYQGAGMLVTYDEPLACIVSEWEGFHSLHTIKTGCLKLLNFVVDKQAKLILNDNIKVIGTWNDAVEWVANEFFPMLQNAGVTHIAWVYSSSTFSRLSADMTIANLNGNIVVETFEDSAIAKQWLHKMSKTYNPE